MLGDMGQCHLPKLPPKSSTCGVATAFLRPGATGRLTLLVLGMVRSRELITLESASKSWTFGSMAGAALCASAGGAPQSELLSIARFASGVGGFLGSDAASCCLPRGLTPPLADLACTNFCAGAPVVTAASAATVPVASPPTAAAGLGSICGCWGAAGCTAGRCCLLRGGLLAGRPCRLPGRLDRAALADDCFG